MSEGHNDQKHQTQQMKSKEQEGFCIDIPNRPGRHMQVWMANRTYLIHEMAVNKRLTNTKELIL